MPVSAGMCRKKRSNASSPPAEAVHTMGLAPVGPVGTLEAAIALAETQHLDGALLDVRLRRGMRV
ncbi:hypothetical protein [Inquilinus limosus]|uniref:Uncharacterized protein n=1 Tax=Inquilinus limosus MP06 TaxID=1398085 RepID=A0A0A0D7D3_9PROT|nr:hypothetical protein [Inquilinus limosus]KGM32882.1 hypothetical protein P409_18880 [Inquilinus limosus MP06]